MPVCAVHGCFASSKTNPNCTFFHLSRSPPARARWLEALGRPLDTPGSLAVCARHFPESAFTAHGRSKLKQRAVPTLYMTPETQQQSASLFVMKKNQHLKKVPLLQSQLAKVNRDFLAGKIQVAQTQPNSEQSVKPGASDDLPVCRVCLAVDEQLYSVWSSRFMDTFAQLTGTSLSAGGFPRRLCGPCRAQLSECAAFRERCRKTHSLLQTLLEWGPLSIDDIKSIDRHSHQLTNSPTRSKECNEHNEANLNIISNVKTEGEENEASHYTEVDILRNVDCVDNNSDDNIVIEVKDEVGKVTLDTDAELYLKTEDSIEIDLQSDNDNVDSDAVIESVEKPNKRDGTTEKNPKTEDCTQVALKCDAKKRKSKPTEKKVTVRKMSKKRRIEELKTAGYHSRCQRKKVGDEYFPDFDYETFEKEYDVKIKFLTTEEQKQEIEDRKKTNEGEFCCKICGKVFIRSQTMKSHLLVHDPSWGRYECEICHRRFVRNSKLLGHRDTHRLSFTCQICGKVSRARSSAKSHFIMHQGKTWQCRHCDQVYERQASYFNHMRITHPGMNVACDECGETFLSEYGVKLHKTKAHRTNVKSKTELTCSVCDVEFSSSAALERHMFLSEGVSHAALLPCGTCGESYESEAALAAHKEKRHPSEERRCDECDTTFANAASFDTHVKRKHLNQRAPQPKNKLKRYVRRWKPSGRSSRSGPQQPVVCEICGRVAKNKQTLRIHMDNHLKPFACPKCPKTFSCRLTRDCHMNRHTGERPYQCSQCPKSFSAPCNLARHHKVVHLNQRDNIPCELCSKTFTTRHSMLMHVKCVHNNLPWPKRERKPKKIVSTDD